MTHLSGFVGQTVCLMMTDPLLNFFAARSPGAMVVKTFEETIEGMNSIMVCH